MKKIRSLSLIVFLGCFLLISQSFATPSWDQWVAALRQDAIAEGIAPGFFDDIFANIRPAPRVLHFDRTQPEKRLDFYKYRNSRVNNYRIMLGRKEYRRNQALLQRIGNDFGVDPCFIVALWGIESSYGRYMGKFPVITSLATLAYDSRRGEFFRRELLYALHIVYEGHIALEQFKGEWAGASGQPQFMPSSWHKFAVDYDQDGRKNIWSSLPDSFASIANYLHSYGWKADEPWAVMVKLPADFDRQLIGKEYEKSVSEWQSLGVRTMDNRALPHSELNASIVVVPNGGPAFLAYQNYKVVLHYNDSIYYAGTVGYLADQICRR